MGELTILILSLSNEKYQANKQLNITPLTPSALQTSGLHYSHDKS